jgi:hypothetical protein
MDVDVDAAGFERLFAQSGAWQAAPQEYLLLQKRHE